MIRANKPCGDPRDQIPGAAFPPTPLGKVRTWGDEPSESGEQERGARGSRTVTTEGPGPPRIATLKLEAVRKGLRPALSCCWCAPGQAAGQGHREGPRIDGGGEAGAESKEHRPELQGCPGEANVPAKAERLERI